MNKTAKTKLYTAWTFMEEYEGHKGVALMWFCVERPQPVAPYTSLIEGYAALTEHARPYSEMSVDEKFTSEEVEELRAYLKDKYGLVVMAEEVQLPAGDNLGLYGPVPTSGHNTRPGRFVLYEEPGYNLSIPIAGYFDLRGAESGPLSERDEDEVDPALERTVEQFWRDIQKEAGR